MAVVAMRYSASTVRLAVAPRRRPPDVAAPDRRGGGAPGAREQPRHPDRADRSADRGSQRRAGARRVVSDVHQHAAEREHRLAEQQLPVGRRDQDQRRPAQLRTSASQQTLPWGGRYNVGWDSSRSTTTNLFSNFSPQVRSSLALTYVQPLLRGFSIDASRQQLLVSRERTARSPTSTLRAGDRGDVANRPQRLLGSGVRHRLARRAAAVARAGAGIAAQHAGAHRDRHHAADRPRRSRGRSGAARGSRDPGEGADRHGGGRAARAHLRSRHRPTSGRCASNRRSCRRSRRRAIDIDAAVAHRARSAHRPRSSRARTSRPTDINLRFFRQPDAARRHRQLRLRPDGPRRHAVPARRRASPARSSARRERGFGSVLGDLFSNDFPSWTASLERQLPARRDAAGRQPRARAAAVHAAADAAAGGRAAGRDRRCARPARQVLTNQQRVETTTRFAAARGAAARGRGAEVRPPARPRASSCSRRSATWRRRATTSCARSSITTARSSTSKPCRRRRSGKIVDAVARTVGSRDGPQCRRCSVTIITLNEAEHIARGDRQRRVGRRDPRRRLRQHRRRRPRSRARRARPWCAATWSGLRRSEELRRRRWRRNDWIFSLDADERIPPALAGEIRELLSGEPPMRGYRVPRVTFHLGRWIRTTDFYPDYQTRLYDRRAARWRGKYVHESVVGRRPGRPLPPRPASTTRSATCATSSIASTTTRRSRRGRCTKPDAAPASFDLLVHPPAAFLRNYLLRRGHSRRHRRPHHLGRQRVLGVPEVREALGTAENSQLPTSQTPKQYVAVNGTPWELDVRAFGS